MKAIKFGLIEIGLCFLILLPNIASARTRFRPRIDNYSQSGFHRRNYFRDGQRWPNGYPPNFYYGYGNYSRPDWERVPRGWSGRDRYERIKRLVNGPTFHAHRCRDRLFVSIIPCPPPSLLTRMLPPSSPARYRRSRPLPSMYDQERKFLKNLRQKEADLLKELEDEEADLLKKLEDGNKKERKKAIDELAVFSFDEKVRTTLEKILLSDPNPELRKEVIKSFAKVKNRKALPVLEKVKAEDPDEDVRKEADKAIKKMKGNGD